MIIYNFGALRRTNGRRCRNPAGRGLIMDGVPDFFFPFSFFLSFFFFSSIHPFWCLSFLLPRRLVVSAHVVDDFITQHPLFVRKKKKEQKTPTDSSKPGKN